MEINMRNKLIELKERLKRSDVAIKLWFFRWKLTGRPTQGLMGTINKPKVISEYIDKYSIDRFIETGTYLGDMVELMRQKGVEEIYSIELGDVLYRNANERFIDYEDITIFHGDSAEVLPYLFNLFYEPCLFWLDAHYSGGMTAKGDIDTPIISELKTILSCPYNHHVILIDDAREFVGANNYPTISEIEKLIDGRYNIENRDDIIRITPKEG